MKRQEPRLTRENYLDVYNRCREQKPLKKTIRLGYAVIDKILKVQMDFADGAREDLDRINSEGMPHIYAFNHLTTDHYVVGSILHQIAPQDVGNVRILGNDVTLNMRSVRPLADAVGAIPVARRVDHDDDPEFVDLCRDELVNCCEDVMNNGYKISIHPEGDTNKADPLHMNKIKQGTALIALRMAPSAITPIGYTYGPGKLKDPKRGQVVARVEPSLFVEPDEAVEQLTSRVQNSLQRAVFIAAETQKSMRTV